MRSAIKAHVSQILKTDYVVSFKDARGASVTSMIRLERVDDQTRDKKLVFVTVLMKGKKVSHVRLDNGDHVHVSNDILTEARV